MHQIPKGEHGVTNHYSIMVKLRGEPRLGAKERGNTVEKQNGSKRAITLFSLFTFDFALFTSCFLLLPSTVLLVLEARAGIEPAHKGFADLSLTTWVPRQGNCQFRIANFEFHVANHWIQNTGEQFICSPIRDCQFSAGGGCVFGAEIRNLQKKTPLPGGSLWQRGKFIEEVLTNRVLDNCVSDVPSPSTGFGTERETGLEPATSTLARLRSTN